MQVSEKIHVKCVIIGQNPSGEDFGAVIGLPDIVRDGKVLTDKLPAIDHLVAFIRHGHNVGKEEIVVLDGNFDDDVHTTLVNSLKVFCKVADAKKVDNDVKIEIL